MPGFKRPGTEQRSAGGGVGLKYLFACPERHPTELPLLWAEYQALPQDGDGNALIDCACGQTAKRQWTSFFFDQDWYGGSGSTEERDSRFDIGLGCEVKNKAHRREIQRERGLQDMCPEDSANNERYLRDIRQAKADGVDTGSIQHPLQPMWDAPVLAHQAKVRAERYHGARTMLADIEVCRTGKEEDTICIPEGTNDPIPVTSNTVVLNRNMTVGPPS